MTKAPVVRWTAPGELVLPPVHVVHQNFDVPAPVDLATAFDSEWERLAGTLAPACRARVAIGVGSRGIDGLAAAVRAVAQALAAAGCDPFVVPAMGSHGGATASGQIDVLAHLGVTPETVGVNVEATMEVVSLGTVEGMPVYCDRLAAEADGIVVVNRVKPHTDFAGPMGSGLLKMLSIGFGNDKGADLLHREGVVRDLGDVVRRVGAAVLERAPVLFGVAILENQRHRACQLRLIPAAEIETEELALQERARELLPGLPLDDIDLLIVDEMGKNISGAGLDPNVIGRSLGPWQVRRERPRITRIFVRDLTDVSEGNACGLGFLDVTTPRLIDKVDLEVTAVNAITACFPEDVRLPLTVPTDRDAVAAMMSTLRPFTAEDLRLVHIRNTLEMETMVVSAGCLDALAGRPGVVVEPEALALGFDADGGLVSPLAALAAIPGGQK